MLNNSIRTSTVTPIRALPLVLILAGCAGGGGGAGPTQTVPPAQTPAATPTPAYTSSTPVIDASVLSVDQPVMPSFGDNPPPAQIATSGASTLLSRNNILFPALATSVPFGAGGVTAVATSPIRWKLRVQPVRFCDRNDQRSVFQQGAKLLGGTWSLSDGNLSAVGSVNSYSGH